MRKIIQYCVTYKDKKGNLHSDYARTPGEAYKIKRDLRRQGISYSTTLIKTEYPLAKIEQRLLN